jgi:hypothetical protein
MGDDDQTQWTVLELAEDEELPEAACQTPDSGGWGDEEAP